MENCRGQAGNSDILYEFLDEEGGVFCIELGNNYASIVASLRSILLSATNGVLDNCLRVRKLPLNTRIFQGFLK